MFRKLNYGFWLGLALIAGYWWLVHPVGFARGYVEDFCSDMSRQVMADSLARFGGPKFVTDRFMAPNGMSVPFFSWSIERDWVGAYVWRWSKDFPFLWAYFGVSLLGTYLGVGWLMGRMGRVAGFSRNVAWGLTTLFVLFHVPRHFKIWHHYEYLSQHWAFWSLFLDAWIWQRFYREKRWSWSLEIWRGMLLLGVLGAPGYFWGPMCLEWVIFRGCLAWGIWADRRAGTRIQIEGDTKSAIFPFVLGLFFVVIDLRWFIPLLHEMKKLGEVQQGLAWFAHVGFMVRPLWLDPVYSFFAGLAGITWRLPTIDVPETVVTIGWLYWIPLLIGLGLLRKKRGGPGMQPVLPFLILLVIGVLYATWAKPFLLQKAIQLAIPFMAFFRVASRWGQFMPEICAVVIVLAWPELSAWFKKRWPSGRKFQVWTAVFVVFSVIEMTWLLQPVNMMPPLDASTQRLLTDLHDAPGTTVLDLPFCVAGGNGVCTGWECPNYPKATVGQCFGSWHEKKVYGLYQARLVDAQCQIYNRPPYLSWFQAWGQQRCFSPNEWIGFCSYLQEHQELAAVLVYPDIWYGAGQPGCAAEFAAHLGAPMAEGTFLSTSTRGGAGADPMRVRRYAPRCLEGPAK